MSIRVAIAGVGNCASSLVQGVEYYKDTKDEDKIPGLMHNNFGGYRVRDIEFVTAFDVDALKVGKDLSEAIGASQNNTIKFADVPNLGVEVLRGPTNDGLGEYYRQMIEESDAEPVDVAQVLRDKKVDVLVSYLPVGSEKADKAYAQAKETVLAELRQTFRPEFLNRIDDIIVFRALTEPDIEEVARRMLKTVAARMETMGIHLDAGDAAVKELAREGFDPKYGARPLRRAIQSKVEDAVAEKLLEGTLKEGDTAKLTVEDDKLVVTK